LEPLKESVEFTCDANLESQLKPHGFRNS